jgi:GNAT superfamily N-acetyltransferase
MSAVSTGTHPGVVIRDSLPDDIGPLLEDYFISASTLCRKVETEQARSAFEHSGGSQLEDLGAYDEASDECLGALTAVLNEWETSFFGCPVIHLSVLVKGNDKQRYRTSHSLLKAWSEGGARQTQGYSVVRVPSDDVALIHALQSFSFNLLVPMVTLDRRLPAPVDESSTELELGPVKESEVSRFSELARSAFNYGRFWVEPRLGQEKAGEMHATWLRNCCNKRLVDEVFVARLAGRPVGFNAVRVRQYGEVRVSEINLIAVDPDARQGGVGKALVHKGFEWASEQVPNMIVRTELPNTAAIRMYERSGFQLGSGSLYFARWNLPA